MIKIWDKYYPEDFRPREALEKAATEECYKMYDALKKISVNDEENPANVLRYY